MAKLFEVIDPRGLTVICTEERWIDHILDAHPCMNGLEEEVQAAIRHPHIGIYQDADREGRHIYYRLRKGRKHYIKVVVDFTRQETGTVITAYPTDAPKSGEKLIWPKSSD